MIALRPSVTLLVFLSTTFNLSAQDRSYGRSVVGTQYGMVATSQVSASQAGALILERGGSAIDAAIAANAVLNVTEPTSNGMGGDLFAIYWEAKTGKIYGLNASGWAPKALTIEHLHQKGDHDDAAIRYRFRHPFRAWSMDGPSCMIAGENCPGAIFSNPRSFMPSIGSRWRRSFTTGGMEVTMAC